MTTHTRTLLRILSALLAGAALAGPAAAGSPDGGHGRWRHGPPPIDGVLERHADELGLDAAMRARIGAIAEQAREDAQPLDEELRGLHDGMRALLEQDAPAAEAVMAQAERIGAAETQLHQRRLATMLEIRALLTPEQRAKLVEIFEARRERWREHGAAGCGSRDGSEDAAPSTPAPR